MSRQRDIISRHAHEVGFFSCIFPFLFHHPVPDTVLACIKMSDKDSSDGIQKEVLNGSVRRTSFTEVDLNKNLSAK